MGQADELVHGQTGGQTDWRAARMARTKTRAAKERQIANGQLQAHSELAGGQTTDRQSGKPPQASLKHVPCYSATQKSAHRRMTSSSATGATADGTKGASVWPDYRCDQTTGAATSASNWRQGDGHITVKYAQDVGVDITYTSEQREQTNLNTCRWRPLLDEATEHHVHA